MSSPSPSHFFFLTIKYASLLRNCQQLLTASRLWPLGPCWSESFPVWVGALHLLHFLLSPKKAVRLSPWCPLETGSLIWVAPCPALASPQFSWETFLVLRPMLPRYLQAPAAPVVWKFLLSTSGPAAIIAVFKITFLLFYYLLSFCARVSVQAHENHGGCGSQRSWLPATT